MGLLTPTTVINTELRAWAWQPQRALMQVGRKLNSTVQPPMQRSSMFESVLMQVQARLKIMFLSRNFMSPL